MHIYMYVYLAWIYIYIYIIMNLERMLKKTQQDVRGLASSSGCVV